MQTNTITENLALKELMNHNGGINADMVDTLFHSPDLIKSLTLAVKNNLVVWDDARIYIQPKLFFAFVQGVEF